MSSARRDELLALVRALARESDGELDAEIEEDTSLIRSGMLDSLCLLQIAEWISDCLGGELDLNAIDIRREWDTVAGILAFLDRRG